jgi:hypothetical protein
MYVFKENLLPRIQASSNYSVLINFHFYDWANMQIGRARWYSPGGRKQTVDAQDRNKMRAREELYGMVFRLSCAATPAHNALEIQYSSSSTEWTSTTRSGYFPKEGARRECLFYCSTPSSRKEYSLWFFSVKSSYVCLSLYKNISITSTNAIIYDHYLVTISCLVIEVLFAVTKKYLVIKDCSFYDDIEIWS